MLVPEARERWRDVATTGARDGTRARVGRRETVTVRGRTSTGDACTSPGERQNMAPGSDRGSGRPWVEPRVPR